jgi:hypothetical protein
VWELGQEKGGANTGEGGGETREWGGWRDCYRSYIRYPNEKKKKKEKGKINKTRMEERS